MKLDIKKLTQTVQDFNQLSEEDTEKLDKLISNPNTAKLIIGMMTSIKNSFRKKSPKNEDEILFTAIGSTLGLVEIVLNREEED